MFRVISFAFMFAGAAIVVGCDGATEKSGQGEHHTSSSKSAGVIGVSLLTLENPFFRVIGDTITSEGAKQGYETIVVSADKDPAKQGNQVKDFIVKKVAAIVLSPCKSRAIVPVIQEANAAGIPVFTVDIPCREPGAKIVSQIATDNLGGGKEAARAMIEALAPSGGKVAILHHKQAESCRLRVQGFTEIVNEHNAKGQGKIEIVSELEGGGLKDEAYRAAQDLLQSHADLRGIFAINDPTALGARAALEKAGKADQVKIVGFDGQLEGKQAIRRERFGLTRFSFRIEWAPKLSKPSSCIPRGKTCSPRFSFPLNSTAKLTRKKTRSFRDSLYARNGIL